MLHDHLSGHHDMRLVLLSIGVAILASYTALDIGNRIKAARGHARLGWLTAGATAMGGGIWSMHFIAMLAFSMAIPIGYDVTLTAASFLVAVLVTGIALFIVSRGALHIGRIVAAGVFMGLGVAAMHYVGMAAMRMAAEVHYDPGLFALSIVIAVVAASAALWLAFTMEAWWHKLASALVMGAAIAGMHYTGMAAAHYQPIDVGPVAIRHTNLSPQFIALGIATAAFYVLCLGLLSAIADRRLSATAAEGAKALRQSERRHHSLVQNSSDIIAILNDHGAFTYCSQSSQRILGYSATWLIGHRLVEFLQSEDAEKFDEFFARVVASPGTTETEEIEIRHADYTWLACEVICNNLKADSAIRGIVVNLRDISERRRVIDELRRAKTLAEQASRIKSEFLAAVSHELRTPLNAVIGFSEVIKGGSLGGEAGPRCMDYATHIHDSARHLLRIINNILDLSKAESGQMKLAEDYFRLASLVTDCVQAHAAEAAAAGLAMDLSLSPALPYFYGDKRRIEQALASVLSNALKFTAPGGRVEVTADADDASGFVIAVRDTGIGMASDEIAMALEPFRQIDARLNRRYEGTGLGLPLTKHLIELHGGALQIDSEPGKGTRVSLRFPAERIVWTADGHDRQRAVS